MHIKHGDIFSRLPPFWWKMLPFQNKDHCFKNKCLISGEKCPFFRAKFPFFKDKCLIQSEENILFIRKKNNTFFVLFPADRILINSTTAVF